MTFLNLVILFVLAAGHAGILAAVINRAHSLRFGHRTLTRTRHVHDLLLFAIPLAAVWYVGIRGPGLLVGGSWADLPVAWAVYFAVCAAGSVGLILSITRWGLRKVSELQRSNHSWTIDIEQRLGYRPVGDGPYRFLTRVPGNEQFQIHVSEKVYELPRLSRDWDGLSILHLADVHFSGTVDRPYYDQVFDVAAGLKADLVAFTGDLLDDSRLVEWIPATLGRLSAPLGCFFVLGNHDWYLQADEIRRHVSDLGWQDLSGRTVTINHNNHRLVLGGTEAPWMGAHPDFSITPDGAFRVLLSHTPDNLAWARKQGVDLMLAGHNHGGQVVLPVLGPIYAPSRHGVKYAAGEFWQKPTLLYVSRGIAGRHALRWNCPPELTKLVLKAR